MKSLLRYLRIAFYTLIGLVFLLFCFANFQRITVSLYPFPYSAEMPLFLYSVLIFVGGMFIGIGLTYNKYWHTKFSARKHQDRVEALENELAGIKSEKQAIEISYSNQSSNV